MAQSAVDMCNSSLQKLGAASITNLADDSMEARQCTVAYDSNRRSELRKYKWNFAINRAALAPDAEAPAFGYTYAFTIPSDCLRVILGNDVDLDWVIEGRKILTNRSNNGVLYLRYIADIVDVPTWDSVFYDIMAIAMAMDMCEALTNSTSKKQALAQEYTQAIETAKRNNAFETMPAESPDDPYWTVRYGAVQANRVNFVP